MNDHRPIKNPIPAQPSVPGREEDRGKFQAMVKASIEKWNRSAADRKKGIEERATSVLPDLTPKEFIVAFIDILGFGAELARAKSKGDLERIYKKLKIVQEEFLTPSASDNPEDQAAENAEYGRTVLILSDAVVVAITREGPASSHMGQADLLGFALSEITSAQARCVHKGIFLRGGISHGSFFYQDNVLISSAMACAYKLETDYARDPIIVLRESTIKDILATPTIGTYAKGADPTPELFMKLRRTYKKERLYFLDYVKIAKQEQMPRMSPDERLKMEAARSAHDSDLAQSFFDKAAWRGEARYLENHKRLLVEAYTATKIEKVRKKYRWLMKYHNQSVPGSAEPYQNCAIDLGTLPAV